MFDCFPRLELTQPSMAGRTEHFFMITRLGMIACRTDAF